jgi:hypothetical protein
MIMIALEAKGVPRQSLSHYIPSSAMDHREEQVMNTSRDRDGTTADEEGGIDL